MKNSARAKYYNDYKYIEDTRQRPRIVKKPTRQTRKLTTLGNIFVSALAVLFFGFVFPTVLKSTYDSIITNRIANSHINIPASADTFGVKSPINKVDYSTQEKINFANSSENILPTSYIDGLNIPAQVNVETPEMLTPKLTSEIGGLKSKLTNLAKVYSTITPGVFIWDFSTGKYVSINGDNTFPTASIIKLPVFCQVFKRAEMGMLNLNNNMRFDEYFRSGGSGHLQLRPAGINLSLDQLATIMIQNSDNSATNMLLTQVGGSNELNQAMRSWGLANTRLQTWLPDLAGTNVSTPKDLGTILYNIDNPKFLTLQSRAKMIDIMSHVKNRSLIQAGLPDNAQFVHKTGNIGTMIGDAGIVSMPNGRKYIIVVLAKRPFNSLAAKQFIVETSKIVYNYFSYM